MDKSFEFDNDTEEFSNIDKPIDVNFRKVDGDEVRKQVVRKLVNDRRDNREGSRADAGSQSSLSNGEDMEVQSQGILGQLVSSNSHANNQSRKMGDELSENPNKISDPFSQIVNKKDKGGLAKKAKELKQKK